MVHPEIVIPDECLKKNEEYPYLSDGVSVFPIHVPPLTVTFFSRSYPPVPFGVVRSSPVPGCTCVTVAPAAFRVIPSYFI